MILLRSLPALLISLCLASSADAQKLPTRVGSCVDTKVKSVSTRLQNGATGRAIPGSGSAISYANGGYQVSYSAVAGVDRSRPGDPIRLCLIRIPKGCPKGDQRGREYRAVNQRTHQSWVLPDSEHACGGA